VSNETIVVLGASSSLGEKVVGELLASGYSVIAQVNRRILNTTHPRLVSLRADLAVNADPLDEIVTCSSREIVGLISLLGTQINFGPLIKQDKSAVANEFNVSVLGLSQVVKLLAPRLKKARRACILVVNSSLLSYETVPKGFGGYYIGKAALKAYCDLLEEELTAANVQIMQIFPRAFDSNLWALSPDFLVESLVKTHANEVAVDLVRDFLSVVGIAGSN